MTVLLVLFGVLCVVCAVLVWACCASGRRERP